MECAGLVALLGRRKRGNWVFLIFPPRGNAVFEWFWFSLRGETQKMGDFDFLSREKRGFYRFSFIIHGWNAVFSVFRSSSVDETQNSLFLAHHPWMKVGFFRFLMKTVGGFVSRRSFLQKTVAGFASQRSAQHERMRNAPLFHEHLQSSTHNFHTFIY